MLISWSKTTRLSRVKLKWRKLNWTRSIMNNLSCDRCVMRLNRILNNADLKSISLIRVPLTIKFMIASQIKDTRTTCWPKVSNKLIWKGLKLLRNSGFYRRRERFPTTTARSARWTCSLNSQSWKKLKLNGLMKPKNLIETNDKYKCYKWSSWLKTEFWMIARSWSINCPKKEMSLWTDLRD